MLSQTEREVLEQICGGSRAALLDIRSLIGKVYDEELACDLNRQAAGYSGFREKAAEGLLRQGIVPRQAGILDMAKRWAALQAGTALNVSTCHVADMVLKEERRRAGDLELLLEKSGRERDSSSGLAEEFLRFEKENIQILGTYTMS